MADQRERRRRKRPAKKQTAGQSAIEMAARARKVAAAKKIQQQNPGMSLADAIKQADNPTQKSDAQLNAERAAERGYKPAPPPGQQEGGKSAQKPAQPSAEALAGLSLLRAADTVTGNARQMQAEAQAEAQRQKQMAIADPKLYGAIRDSDIRARLEALKAESQQQAVEQYKSKGQAVYLGPNGGMRVRVRRQIKGGEFEGGPNRIPELVPQQFTTKAELMSWLSDPGRIAQIKKRMIAAGFDVQTYEDIAKLWASVVDQAADTYSFANKKISPWAILQLRGKMTVNGKPAPKTVTSTSTDIEELDPAMARALVEKSAQDALGRAPTQAEVDDFLAKAQLIAKQNPRITRTTTTITPDFDNTEKDRKSRSVSSGGVDVVNAKASQMAQDQYKDTEEYSAYQAAGVYFPLLFDALNSPV